MKRRRFFKAIAAAPAVPAVLLAQQQQPVTPPRQPGGPGSGGLPTELPKLETGIADEVGESPAPKFFTAPQFAAMKKLSAILMPSINDAPGAIEAKAPEFLDFLLSQSPGDRKTLYRAGLDALNAAAQRKFTKPFAGLTDDQGGTLLAPLKDKWNFDAPADPLARFLWAAKADVRNATLNSKEYASAQASGGRRGFGGVGLYWFPLD